MDQQNNGLVVICGASAGVGRATAHRFAAAGYRIGLLARDEAALAATREELKFVRKVNADRAYPNIAFKPENIEE